LADLSFPVSRFEREMRDLLGITPVGHPDPRPLVRHGFWPESFHPLRHDAVTPEFADDGRPFPFTAVEGDGVYEIPVGPVHAGVDIPDGAKAWRAILLELERVYNHITDVGAIIADTGFPVGQAHCMRLRERILRLNKVITGSRLMRGAIVPGGVSVLTGTTGI